MVLQQLLKKQVTGFNILNGNRRQEFQSLAIRPMYEKCGSQDRNLRYTDMRKISVLKRISVLKPISVFRYEFFSHTEKQK
jgi:hypothetical protein